MIRASLLPFALTCLVGCGDARVDAASNAAPDTTRTHPQDSRRPFVPGHNPSAMAAENRKPGSPTWTITQAASNHEIEGYASSPSAAPGDTVTLFVNVSDPHAARWELYRVGYYGGVGARLVATAPFAAAKQKPCPVDPDTGLVECAWAPSATITVEGEWFTGQYLFKLTREDGFESYVPLVIRESVPKSPILYQASVTTWQAYNLWGGSSLYKNLLPVSAGYTPDKARRVSFDRPYEYKRPIEEGQPETELGAGHLFLAEIFMLQWLEMKGYDVAYVTNLDVDQTPEILTGRRLFLSVGHDEYWTQGERDAVDHARDAGVSLGFFSANDAYWRIRLDASSSGVPNRVVTCYKNPNLDPDKEKTERTVRFRDSEPEDLLIGQMYGLFTSLDAFPMVVGDPSNWLYQGTHVSKGDTLSHVVGYEWDRVQTPALSPPSLEIIGSSPVVDHFGLPDVSNVTAYYPTSSSLVFSAGTIEWSWGLGKPGFVDDRIKRMTENVLTRAGLSPFTVTPVPPLEPDLARDSGDASSVTLVAGTGSPGYADGANLEAEFDSPLGVAVDGEGVIYVTEARNHRVRKIAKDQQVSTLAGCAPDDQHVGSFADGDGTDACFNLPSGIAVAKDGTIYVSDTNNHRIRAITPTGTVTTIAGDGGTSSRDSEDPLDAGIPYPRGFAIGPDGAFYVVADATTIRRIDASGVTTVATSPSELSGVAVGPDGTVYVVATGAATVSRLLDGHLVPLVNPLGIFGDRAGSGDTAMLRPAEGLVVDGDGRSLIVSDSANYKVRRIDLSPGHLVTTLVGDGSFGDALGTAARVVNPRGLAVMPSGSNGPSPGGFLLADSGNHRILRVTPP